MSGNTVKRKHTHSYLQPVSRHLSTEHTHTYSQSADISVPNTLIPTASQQTSQYRTHSYLQPVSRHLSTEHTHTYSQSADISVPNTLIPTASQQTSQYRTHSYLQPVSRHLSTEHTHTYSIDIPVSEWMSVCVCDMDNCACVHVTHECAHAPSVLNRLQWSSGQQQPTTQTPSTGLRHPSFNHCRI